MWLRDLSPHVRSFVHVTCKCDRPRGLAEPVGLSVAAVCACICGWLSWDVAEVPLSSLECALRWGFDVQCQLLRSVSRWSLTMQGPSMQVNTHTITLKCAPTQVDVTT